MRSLLPTLFSAPALLFVAATPVAAAEAPAVWQPAGPTRLDQQPEFCTLSREFASGDERLVVQFRTSFSLTNYMATLASPTALHDVRPGQIDLSLVGSDNAKSFGGQNGTVPGRNEQFLQIYVNDFNLPALVKGDQNFRFSSGSLDAELRWPSAGDAFGQFARCHEALLADMGIDTALARATPVMPKPAAYGRRWVTHSDYPVSAIQSRLEGEVGFLITVGSDGSVSECRIVKSSGHDILDSSTCDLIRRRAKFDPARNENGEAVAGYYLSKIQWSVP
ncbi:energy transducer TonB [Sphingopyxis sp. KK2]|uniref:energy transducer TonB n=1 Tax=Sphingopyxis sp. KK2 TaxID=1855727 RepID=UPI00097E614E|nr:energy transducer TonB [Sphingopyxis sp. KK2]